MVINKYSSSSSLWLRKHFSDKYFQQVKKNKLRSRAWFKLDEINKNYSLFHPGMRVIDLGCSPGGWSQYVINNIGKNGRVISCDVLPMNPIGGVDFLQADLRKFLDLQRVLKWVGNEKVQVILSDMAPNMSGISIIDISKSIFLGEIALCICRSALSFGGDFLVKIFQGEGFEKYIYDLRAYFARVKICKPDASRSRSREVYIIAKGYKHNSLR